MKKVTIILLFIFFFTFSTSKVSAIEFINLYALQGIFEIDPWKTNASVYDGLDIRGVYKSLEYGITIEITEVIKKIDNDGIEVFTKAWIDGKPVGFGYDGTVEIERFRVFNPPIFVPDEYGTYIREWLDEETGEIVQSGFREDLPEAIRQVISHNVTLVGKDGSNIIKGKIGNTTSTFYPDPSAETSTVDGFLTAAADPWVSARSASSGTADDSSTTMSVKSKSVHVGGPEPVDIYTINRLMTYFDTSSISASDTVDSATYSLWATATTNGDNDGTDYVSIVSVQGNDVTSDTAVTNTDFNEFNTTEAHASGQRKDISSISTGTYTVWTLNSTGLALVARSGEAIPTGATSGITYLGAREGHDRANSEPAESTENSVTFYSADRTGTTNDPKLVVTHTGDTTAPDAVSDLATTGSSTTTVGLSWTAPGDDESTGTATTYDVRYSTSEITSGNFSSAAEATGEPSPSVATTPESMTVTGLTINTQYYFAIKTDDEIPNTSAISNVVSLFTTSSSKIIRLFGNIRLRGIRLR